MKTEILSNGSPRMLHAAVASAKLSALLDAVLSVEELGVYKPHPKVYGLAVDRLGVPASAIAFQSSNAWDAYAASAFGMQVVWCNRYGQRRERLPGAPEREVRSLVEFAGSGWRPNLSIGVLKNALGIALEARVPVCHLRWYADPFALCRAHRWNHPQSDQSR